MKIDIWDGLPFIVKILDSLAVGSLQVAHFAVEVGALDYGFDLQGILGMDLLLQAKATIDLDQLTLT